VESPTRPVAHLHNHTTWSVRDGLQRLEPMIEAAAADGQPAIAVTDHGSLGASWKFAKVAEAAGIKPILGAELYLAFGDRHDHEVGVAADIDSDSPDGGMAEKKYQHLTVLAQTPKGWENLLQVSNEAHDSFWSKPRTDMDLLADHSEGMICLTGCIGGPVAGRLLAGQPDVAEANLARLVDIYGKESVYVEVMDHGIEAERAIVADLIRLADRFGIGVVATNDAHFTRPGEAHAHEAWLCMGQDNITLDSPDRWTFNGSGYHLRSATEMRALFDDQPGTEHAVDATLAIAEKIADRVLPEPQVRIPHFDLPPGVTADEALTKVVKDGAKRLYGYPASTEVRDRIMYELRIIKEKRFADYFLITKDEVDAARAHGIRVGPGRGSAAGAIVAYCCGITTIDPIKYGLLFERFLSPDRTSMPDIDVDFEVSGREWVFDYLTKRWGSDRTARIGTYGKSMTNASLRSAGRVLGSPTLGARLAGKVPTIAGKPLTFDQLENPSNKSGEGFRALVESEPSEELVDIAKAFEGVVSSEGIHACGFVISDRELSGLVPLRRDRRSPDCRLVTEWEGTDIEEFGLLKLDVLVIRNLDVITRTEQIVNAATGEVPDSESAYGDIDDPDPIRAARSKATWELIAAGNTGGCFQLESPGMTKLCQQMAPTSLYDLSAIIALFRPGPLGDGLDQRYVERMTGREEVDYEIYTMSATEAEAIASVLDETYGLPIYQENLMRLGEVVAGFDAAARNNLQKAIGKKKQDLMDEAGRRFLAGAVSDVDMAGQPKLAFRATTARALWQSMAKAGSYAFNKSHSLGYAKVAYETAYLKANWPEAFGAGLLSVTDSDEKRSAMLRSLTDEGITIGPPDVNCAEVATSLDSEGVIRFGLAEISGVGEQEASAIVAERETNGAFSSLSDFTSRVTIAQPTDDPDDATETGKMRLVIARPGDHKPLQNSAIEALIESGAFDGFGPRLGQVIAMRAVKDVPEVRVPNAEWGAVERTARERARLGVCLSPNPLIALKDQVATWRSSHINSKPEPLHKLTTPNDQVTTIGTVSRFAVNKSGNRRANMTLEGSKSTVECIVWSNVLSALESSGRLPVVGQIVGVTAKVKVAKFARRQTDDLNDSDEGELVTEVVEEAPRTELQISDIWSGELDDPPSITLPPAGMPGFRIVNPTAANPPHLAVVQPELSPQVAPAQEVAVTGGVPDQGGTEPVNAAGPGLLTAGRSTARRQGWARVSGGPKLTPG
jgi:DNA polymerase-3 subunit alpha